HPGGAGVVVVDKTDPHTVALTAPLEGTRVEGSSVTITASGGDENGATFTFLVNGAQIASGTDPSVTWNSTTVSDGDVTVEARVSDPAGNSVSDHHTVTVDNTAPAVSVDDPGAAISGSKTISATPRDNDTKKVEFKERAQGAASWNTIGTDQDGAP